MRIWHDYSCVGKINEQLLQSGFAKDDIFSIRLSFSYTQEEQNANRDPSKQKAGSKRKRRNAEEAQRRSNAIFEVVKVIADHFACDQFDRRSKLNLGEKWELFFWCNDFCNTAHDYGLYGRDYSYVTLTLNTQWSVAERKALCSRVTDLITSQFSTHLNLDVAVQHSAWLDWKRIKEAAAQVLPSLVNKPCSYAGMEGKIIQTEEGVFFVKNRWRKNKRHLSAIDLLDLAGYLSGTPAKCEVQDE